MSKGRTSVLTAVLLGIFWSAGPLAEQETAASDGSYTSTKERGVVSIVPEPALSDGRLILKVVAFNRVQAPAAFGSDSIEIFTAAGKPVVLLSLETLIAEAQSGGGSTGGSVDSAYQQSSYGRPSVRRTQTGEADVSGYAGQTTRSIVTWRHARPRPGGVRHSRALRRKRKSRACALQFCSGRSLGVA